MKVLCDTNVILDFLMRRQPWFDEAKTILQAHRDGRLELHVTATTLTDVYYISRRHGGRETAWRAVRGCLRRLTVIEVGQHELQDAVSRYGHDFEDDLQMACAVSCGLDLIVTRDTQGFHGSPLPAVSPTELLAKFSE